MLTSRFRIGAAVLVFALLVCAPALAQRPRPDRPYRGLFGGNGADPNSTQQFDLNVSFFGAYDDNVLADRSQSGIDPRFQKSGGYGGGIVSLDYTKRAGRATFDFTGGTSYRYYPSIKEMDGFNSFASVGLTAKVSSRTDFRATESASYSPFYALGALPGLAATVSGQVAPISPDYPLIPQSAVSLYSSASLDHRFTSRSSFSTDYMVDYIDYRSASPSFDNWAAGAGYSYRLSSRTTARLGYHYGRGTYGFSQVSQRTDETHNVDFGMDFSHPLSPSRTMTFGFSIGTSLYRNVTPSATVSATDLSYKTRYFTTGSAYLSRQVSRSWSATLSYSRGLQYVQGFSSPFFSDSVSAGLNGFISARSRVNLAASYSSGQVGIAVTGQGYDTYAGVAGYQFALARSVALFADYNYYRYVFDSTVALLPGMNRGLNRNSIRGGVNLWLPLLR